ncbi:MAG: soluble NSF attachment family protein [Treponemataceae bacterium]|nr:soluble NSF attachment family protein [Treponemataceae bacterium]
MKRILLVFLVFLYLLLPASAAETDSQLFSRLTAAYDSGYYPAVLTISEKFLSDFPYSQFAERVRFIRGKSFFRLSRYAEAAKEFEFLIETNGDAAYWQGMAYYCQQNFESAYASFYKALKLISLEEASGPATELSPSHDFSKRSLLLYSAFSADNCGKKDEAASILEYTLINFKMEEDFQPAVQLLFSIYKEKADKEKLKWLYRQINGVIDCFPEIWSHAMLYYMAEAYSGTGEYKSALEIFYKLLECNEKAYQAAALQNMFLITTDEEITEASPLLPFTAYEVLDGASAFFPEGDIQLCDLWMKLAVKNWNDGKNEEAMTCFEKAEHRCEKALLDESLMEVSRIQGYIELAGLYEAEYFFSNGKMEKAVEILKERADPSGNHYPEYMVLLAHSSALAGRNDLCGDYAEKAIEKLEKSMGTAKNNLPEKAKKLAGDAYFYLAYSAAAGMKTAATGAASNVAGGSWAKVLDACKKRYEITGAYDYPQSLLYAESLILADGSELAVAKAMDIFEAMSLTEADISVLADRTKALILTGNYEKAYKLGGNVKVSEADDEYLYLMGLAATGCGVWKTAESLLGTSTPYGIYYTAYALYRQSNTKDAFTLFQKFYTENMYHRMARNACFYAAVCALQNGDGENALLFAQYAVDKSVLPEQKLESSVLCASIYNDRAMYAQAERLLEAYAPSSESVSLNLLLSQIYSAHASSCKKNGDLSTYEALLTKADNLLLSTEMYFKNIPETKAAAEEAAFRRAELYYSSAEYAKAADSYELFREEYPESSFYVQALFYNALSLKNTGRENEATLLFERCASSNKYNDTFGFPALRQLIELYKSSMEYKQALSVAERALSEYPAESKSSGIATTIQNLRLMVEGTDETIAALRTKYEDLGRSTTPEGRKCGFSLALEYMNTVSERQKGEEVLKDIINSSSSGFGADADDRFIIGESYELLGLYYRQLGKENDAAECYLSAAECFATVDKGKAAEVLYNAIDIFVSEGRGADAEAVYRTLVSLDSGSQWAERAADLLIIF